MVSVRKTMCDSEWKRGFPVEKLSAKESVNVKSSFNCKVQLQDTTKYVLVELPKDEGAYERFVGSIELYDNVATLPDGLYTWILPSPTTIAMTPVYSAIEAGSAHMTIAYRVGAAIVYGAGELLKQGDTITYNVLSGTYMLKWLDSVPTECRETLESDVRSAFERLAPGSVHIQDTMITKDIKISQKDLDWYTEHGFRVSLFDDAKSCLAERDRLKLAINAEIQAKQRLRALQTTKASSAEIEAATRVVAEASARLDRIMRGSSRRKRKVGRRSLRLKRLHRAA